MLDGKEVLDQYDFNWTPPSAPEDTLSGLKLTFGIYAERKRRCVNCWKAFLKLSLKMESQG